MTLSHSPTFLPFQQDWHKADIIAALHKKAPRWLPNPAPQA